MKTIKNIHALPLACLTSLLIILFASSTFAIDTNQYNAMLKNPSFADVDQRMRKALDEAKASISQEAYIALERDYNNWLAFESDKLVDEMLQYNRDMSRVQAYIKLMEIRILEMKSTAKKYDFMFTKTYPEGYFVRSHNGEETGWVYLKWINEKKIHLELEISAISIPISDLYFNQDQDIVQYCEFDGVAELKENKAIFENGIGGEVIVTFSKDTLTIETNDQFNQCPRSVTFEGIYLRQKPYS